MTMKQSIIIAAILLALHCSSTIAADATITGFTSRTTVAGWGLAWVVKQADVTTCLATAANCCFSAGTITPTIAANLITFTGPATGAADVCGAGATTLTVTFAGNAAATDLNPITGGAASGSLQITDTIGGTAAPNGGSPTALIVMDKSAEATPSYAIQLPSIHTAYAAATANNLLYVPTTTTSTPTSAIALIASFCAMFAFLL